MTYSPFSHCHSKYYEWCMTTWLFCSWMTTNLLSVEWLTSVFSVLNCWPASQWPLKQNAKYFPPWTFITHIGATCVPLNVICDSGPSDAVFSFGNMSIVVPPRCVQLLSCMKAMMVPWDCVLAEGCPGLSQTGLSVWAGAGASWVQFCSWFALEDFTCSTLSLINRSGL